MTSPGTVLAISVCATDLQGWSHRRGAISLRQPVGLVLAQFVFLPLNTCCPSFLRLAYVQSPHNSTTLPCPRSFICLSGLLWGTVTHKTQHSVLLMDPLDNPDLPFVPVYHNSPTTTDDVQTFYRAQFDVMTMSPPSPPPPPGAAPTYPTTSILPPQVGPGTRFLSPTEHYDHTIEMPTPLSTDSPSDGSETSLYDPSMSTHDYISPTPRVSHMYKLRRPRPRRS